MEEFRQALINAINNSELPFEARFYVIKDIYRDLVEMYEQALRQGHEQKAQEKVEAEEVE